ncbi:TAXI family TRAP transporter solute-binding subunit [Methylocella sp.]|uniref:TAXI family TRAP transporter solute-binding subunit n=1 Tax=Methylocella sp. TaxID=1978226 RepID=UPI0037835ED3
MAPRALLRVSAFLLLIAAVALAGYVAYRSFTVTVRVAVPPLPREAQRAWMDLGRAVNEENGWVRLARLPAANEDEAAKALVEGKADAAILRTDLAFPPQAKTIAILRRDRLFLIVPANSSIDSFQDLKGHAVGMLPGPPGDAALLDGVLNFFSVAPDAVERIPVTAQGAGAAVRQKRVAAVFVVGRAGRGQASEAFASIARATRGTPNVVGVDDGDAVAERLVTLEPAEIPAGSFGGSTPRPDEDVSTLAAAWRLVAGPSLSDLTVGTLTRQLYEAKGRLLAIDPALSSFEAPDTEKSTFPVHPAAKAYYDDDETSVFDRFESFFWIGSATVGVLGSLMTWLLAKLRLRDAEETDLRRLLAILGEVRRADRERLGELSADLDSVVARLLSQAETGSLDEATAPTYQLAVNYARQAIADRAAMLGPGPAGAPG